MNARQRQAIAIRAASLLASMGVTAVLVGSQLVIADGYIRQAGALLATKNTPPPVAQRAAPAPQPHT